MGFFIAGAEGFIENDLCINHRHKLQMTLDVRRAKTWPTFEAANKIMLICAAVLPKATPYFAILSTSEGSQQHEKHSGPKVSVHAIT